MAGLADARASQPDVAASVAPRARAFPPLRALDADLARCPRYVPWFVIGRPLALLMGFAWSAHLALTTPIAWVAVGAVFAVYYVALLVAVHDLGHSALGLTRAWNQRWLSFLGMLGQTSGTAIAATHAVHHKRFLQRLWATAPMTDPVFADDPELAIAALPKWKLLAFSPFYQFSLWRWARTHRPALARRCGLEATGHLIFGLASIGLLVMGVTPICFIYQALIFLASMAFPVLNVWVFHDAKTEDPLRAAHSFGAVGRVLTFGLSDHLVHHVYPAVPSWNMRRLVTLLDLHRPQS